MCPFWAHFTPTCQLLLRPISMRRAASAATTATNCVRRLFQLSLNAPNKSIPQPMSYRILLCRVTLPVFCIPHGLPSLPSVRCTGPVTSSLDISRHMAEDPTPRSTRAANQAGQTRDNPSRFGDLVCPVRFLLASFPSSQLGRDDDSKAAMRLSLYQAGFSFTRVRRVRLCILSTCLPTYAI